FFILQIRLIHWRKETCMPPHHHANDTNATTPQEIGGGEPMSNHSNNPDFSTILQKRLSRRQILRSSLGAAIVGLFSASGLSTFLGHAAETTPDDPRIFSTASTAAAAKPPTVLNPVLNFFPVPP